MSDLPQPKLQLIDRLAKYATDTPDALAYTDAASGQILTYGDLFDRSQKLSRTLRATVPGQRVILIRTANTLDFPISFLAVLMSGHTVFPISTETPEIELQSISDRCQSPLLIEASAFRPLNKTTSEPMPSGLMLLSSGSTGSPKIVCRSGVSLDAVCNQMCQSIRMTCKDRVLATVPLCHSYGLEHGLLAPIWAGATVHLTQGLNLPLVQQALTEPKVTLLPSVPSMYEMLGNLAAPGQRFPSLRAAYSAGAMLPASVADRFHRTFGLKIGSVFGATEIGSVTYADAGDPAFDSATVGKPMLGVQLSIEDNLLSVKADSMFSGYLGESNPINADGFYPTGDLAELDAQGNLIITGRAKLLIDIGGLKVNPLEVEQVLMQHPGVEDCVVIPVRQSETVVRLKAIVCLRQSGVEISMDELRQFARDRLAGYKVPRLFEARDRLPRTQTGKILRQQVTA